MLCNTAEKEKIAAKRHFFAKGTQSRRVLAKSRRRVYNADTPTGMEAKR